MWILKTLRAIAYLVLLVVLSAELSWRLCDVKQREYVLRNLPFSVPLSSSQTSLLIPQPPQSVVTRDGTAEPAAPAAAPFGQPILSNFQHLQISECIRPQDHAVPEVKKQQVYRWVDDNGQIHFGDRPTADADDLSDQYQRSEHRMVVSIDNHDWAGSPSLRADLEKEGQLVFRILSSFLPKHLHRSIALNITVFEDQHAFAVFRAEQGIANTVAAYYVPAERRIYMPMFANHEMTTRVARHEMTHAMTMAMMGTLPTWLTEGLAEYMERLQFTLSAARIEADAANYIWLANQSREDLSVFTARPHQAFYASNTSGNYVRASALIHFLMGHDDGKRWMQSLIGHYIQVPCDAFDPAASWANSYPGGINDMTRRFQTWLTTAAYRTHRY